MTNFPLADAFFGIFNMYPIEVKSETEMTDAQSEIWQQQVNDAAKSMEEHREILENEPYWVVQEWKEEDLLWFDCLKGKSRSREYVDGYRAAKETQTHSTYLRIVERKGEMK